MRVVLPWQLREGGASTPVQVFKADVDLLILPQGWKTQLGQLH